METSARVLLGGIVAIVLVHYLQGGREQVKRWANYAFTGRGLDGLGKVPTVAPGKPSRGAIRS